MCFDLKEEFNPLMSQYNKPDLVFFFGVYRNIDNEKVFGVYRNIDNEISQLMNERLLELKIRNTTNQGTCQ